MINVTVCIGSSCHLKGSRQVVERLQYLLSQNGLEDDVKLSGAFCMGKCASAGVNVDIDGAAYAVTPEGTDEFFEKEILQLVARRD